MIIGSHIRHTYSFEGGERVSLDDIDISIGQGEFVVILGHNGSGKSTLAKHLNALIPLQSGQLLIAGLDVRDKKNLYDIRRAVGMVFQNPDN